MNRPSDFWCCSLTREYFIIIISYMDTEQTVYVHLKTTPVAQHPAKYGNQMHVQQAIMFIDLSIFFGLCNSVISKLTTPSFNV